jgi:hypothetical protein
MQAPSGFARGFNQTKSDPLGTAKAMANGIIHPVDSTTEFVIRLHTDPSTAGEAAWYYLLTRSAGKMGAVGLRKVRGAFAPPAESAAALLEPRDANVRIGHGRIRFSQGDVSAHLRDGTSLGDVINSMRENGWNPEAPPAEMVEFPDGGIVTLDHRRIVAARMAGLEEVPARVHGYVELMPAESAGKYRLRVNLTDPNTGVTYKRGQLPSTWGEAAMFRSANQRAFCFPDFPTLGSIKEPIIRPPNYLQR